ncbi:methyltransferase, FxLD system [Streptomyces sp. NPDC006984]|uniref:methyltransferase, FxLD system n=1 Tax=Streptomyces sp. NPDC006984 TaxID=3155463 RepID=UPI0033E886F7
MTAKPLHILTGINRTSEPSSGSMILASDLYRAMPETHTTFLGREPVDPAWSAAFDQLIPLSTPKRPQGPDFAPYVEELTREVGTHIERTRPHAIHAQYLGFALSLAFTRTAGSIPIISIAHGPEVMAAERNERERETLHEVASASTAIVAPTAALANRIDLLTGRRFTDRLTVVPWGIRLSDARVRDQPPPRGGPLSLVHAGRLDDNKSTITAVEALACANEAHHLTVIGEGSLRDYLEQRAVELGLQDRVQFEPLHPRAELWCRLPNFDAFIFTTRGLEAFGLVLIEAQAHGLPVAHSDLAGVREVLGNTGVPYTSGDPRSLAVALDEMGRDFRWRKALTKAALHNARRYDIAATGRQLRELTLRVTSQTTQGRQASTGQLTPQPEPNVELRHVARRTCAAPPTTTVSDVNSDTVEVNDADRLRAQLVDRLVESGSVRTPRVEDAMRSVPRHVFVPDAPLEKAYGNAPVNIKYDESGTSISCASQPDIVGKMLEQLDVEPGHRVLELGAGTGFNAGLLGYLVGDKGHVTTIDVDDDLVEGARAGLVAANIDNVEVVLGDGALGHADNAPYDRIVATVGAHGVPHAWLDQLAPGGRLLTPLRLRGSVSRSIAFEQAEGGAWRSIGSEMNTFMPLRQGIADDARRFVKLTDDGSVTLVTNGDQAVDAEALAGALTQTRTEVWTGVNFRGPESAEWMELWLTCAMPNGLSRMPATREAIDRGVVTAPYASSTATFEGGTLTYLTRRTATEKAPDGATLYEFGVIGHGPDAVSLADRVAEQIRVWDHGFRGHDVAFEIQPLDTTPPTTETGRFAFDNPLNRVIIEWQ